MIKILLFADLQEKVGKPQLELNLEQVTVQELKEELQKIYPVLDLEKVMIAVNEEYAFAYDDIKSGDTVAFIPPVSGG